MSLVTGPLHTIALSMQLSVIPHLTIYGDIKPSQLKQGLLTASVERIKLIGQKDKGELVKVMEGQEKLTEYELRTRAIVN